MAWTRGRRGNAEIDTARLVSASLRLSVDAWANDFSDIEVDVPTRRRPGRPRGNIKPDAVVVFDDDHLLVIEVETTNDPVINLSKWWRWTEQRDSREVVFIHVYDRRTADESKVVRGVWMGRRIASLLGGRFAFVPVHLTAGDSLPDDPELLEQLAPARGAIARLIERMGEPRR